MNGDNDGFEAGFDNPVSDDFGAGIESAGESADGGGFGDDSGSLGGGGDIGNALLSSEDILKRGRELALMGVPLQVSNLFESLAQLRARATGSTAEIFPAIISQLSALRSQYASASQAISRRLGFAGGGQVKREQGKALAGAARQYGELVAKDQQTSFANLINTLSGLQPALSGNARPPNVSTKDIPIDLTQQGAALASMVSAAQKIQKFYNRNTTPSYAQQSPLGSAYTSLPYGGQGT